MSRSRSRRVLVATLHDLVPPEGPVPTEEVERAKWKTDYDVVEGLRELGHEVRVVGLGEDLAELREAIDAFRPHVVFNLLEQFAGHPRYVPHVIGWLELIGQAYTGCNPIGMAFSNDKARQRKILRHHRVPVPDFMIVRRGRTARRPARLAYPLIVKSLIEHGSVGIAHASIVDDDEKLVDRVRFIHESLGTDAIAEEYVEGRELYLGMIGNERLDAFPAWELRLTRLREGAPHIATQRIKWDVDYQKRIGLEVGEAQLEPALRSRIERLARRAYRGLEQSGYARFDFRLAADDRLVLIESNPNPDLAYDAEFAHSAEAAGLSYGALLQRIVSLGERWSRRLPGA